MKYLFDANTLIEAKNRYYGFEICPAFWDWLLLERSRGTVASIAAVRVELEDPDIKAWADANKEFFEDESAGMGQSFGDVSKWVMGRPQYRADAKERFLSKADPRLIAFAHAQGHAVVTQEVAAPLSESKIKIPDVCVGMGMGDRVFDTFSVLNTLHARFILEVGR